MIKAGDKLYTNITLNEKMINSEKNYYLWTKKDDDYRVGDLPVTFINDDEVLEMGDTWVFVKAKNIVSYVESNNTELILKNIKRQKQKINNSKEYTDDEKALIMKGIDMAYDRVHSIPVEKHLLINN